MTQIKHTLFCGEEAVSARNDELQMTIVPGWGSNLISLISIKDNLELLKVPSSAAEFWSRPVLYGTPILFPPNRIEDGEFSFNGQTYQFDINDVVNNNHSHGFTARNPWKLTLAEVMQDKATIETEFDSTLFPEVMRQFPHPLMIKMTYVLENSRVSVNATIKNKGDQAFPWGLGYHTTFNFPFRTEDSLEQCSFSVTAEKRWELNDRMLPTGKLMTIADLTEWQQGLNLVGRKLDDVFLTSASVGDENQAVLIDNNIGLKVTYNCDNNFKHWVIYNGDGKQGFLCPEPYTWVTNAPNLALPESLTGLQVLQPGEETTVESQIRVSFSPYPR